MHNGLRQRLNIDEEAKRSDLLYAEQELHADRRSWGQRRTGRDRAH